MKKEIYTQVMCVLLAAATLYLVSCRKTVARTTVSSYTNTLLQQIGGDTNLIIFNAALERAGMDSVFGGGGPFTVFAPVDSAFINAGLTVEAINGLSTDSIQHLLGYHIVRGRVSSSTTLGYLKQKMVSLNPFYEPYVIKNYYGIFLNGIHVDQANIACADGVLQKIGRVSFPPTGNLYQVISQRPDLTIMAYILHSNAIYFGPVRLADMLNSPPDSFYVAINGGGAVGNNPLLHSNFTLLLPSDSALLAAGLTIDSVRTIITLNDVTQGPPPLLMALWSRSLVCDEYFTSDFLQGFRIDGVPANAYSYAGNGLEGNGICIGIGQDGRSVTYVFLYNGTTEAPLTNETPFSVGRITVPDVVATNGTIQILDSVIAIQ